MANRLEITYDNDSDVLYVTILPTVAASSDEGAPGVLWRHAIGDGRVVGVTILDFDHYWRSRLDELTQDLSRGLSLSKRETRQLLESVN
jgi:uncharacterized protein YuzE